MEKNRSLKVNEIFFSIQGESTHAGRPCVFVRLMGCPLRCTYCDTEYAFFEGQTLSFDHIISEIKKTGCRLVEVTGGEPLAQPNTPLFLKELLELQYEVLLETSGAFPTNHVPPATKIILDIKTPGSKESHRQKWDNLTLLRSHDEVKFVVCSHEDFKYAEKIAVDHRLFEKCTVLVSPSHGVVTNKQIAEWILESKLPFRQQLQLHKYTWGADVRGV